MLNCLIAGKLTKPPAGRTGASGNPYATACILASAGKDESYIVNAVAFSEQACDALMALRAGDAVSVAGSFKPSGWQKEDGTIGLSVSVVANAVLTLGDAKQGKHDRQAQAKPRPASPARQAPRPPPPPPPELPPEAYGFDDEILF